MACRYDAAIAKSLQLPIGLFIQAEQLLSLLHIDRNFIGAFLMGNILAVIAIRYASLCVSISVHAEYNAIIFALERGFGFSLVAEKSQLDSALYWLPELSIMVFGTIAVWIYLKVGLRGGDFDRVSVH